MAIHVKLNNGHIVGNPCNERNIASAIVPKAQEIIEPQKMSRFLHDGSKMITYLNSCLEGQERITRICHFEDAPKPILRKITNFQYFKIRGYGPKIEFADKNIIHNDGRLRTLV